MFAVRENKQVPLCVNTSEVVSERWKMVYVQDKYYNKRKDRQCGIVVDAQMLSMMTRKIQWCANCVLPGFTSDVQA